MTVMVPVVVVISKRPRETIGSALLFRAAGASGISTKTVAPDARTATPATPTSIRCAAGASILSNGAVPIADARKQRTGSSTWTGSGR